MRQDQRAQVSLSERFMSLLSDCVATLWSDIRHVGALTLIITLITLSSREASAHAWAKQKPVLFMSAEVSPERLRVTLCLPAPLLNLVLTQPIDANYTLSPELQAEVFGQLERYFQSHNPILVDGVRVRPNLSALDLVLSAPLNEVESAALAPNTKLHSGDEGAAILTLDVGLKGTPKLLSLRSSRGHPSSSLYGGTARSCGRGGGAGARRSSRAR